MFVARDGVEPRQELGVLDQAMRVARGREPCFLEEILGFAPIAGETRQERPDARVVASIDLVERARIAARSAEDESARTRSRSPGT
jgi:hypothetical protein